MEMVFASITKLCNRSWTSGGVIFSVAILSWHEVQCENETFCNCALYCQVSIVCCFVDCAVRESDFVWGGGRRLKENVVCYVLKNAGILNLQVIVRDNCSMFVKRTLCVPEYVVTFNFIFVNSEEMENISNDLLILWIIDIKYHILQ